jgi:hypothetical protein
MPLLIGTFEEVDADATEAQQKDHESGGEYDEDMDVVSAWVAGVLLVRQMRSLPTSPTTVFSLKYGWG